MARKLPWQQKQNAAPGPTALDKSDKKAASNVTNQREDNPESHKSSPKSRRSARPARELSSSPPPETLPSPPQVAFMKEGLDADDIWIMVEDEFMTTARDFTRHLHQAEYNRLKSVAKTRNASSTNNFARPERRQSLTGRNGVDRQIMSPAKKRDVLVESVISDAESDDAPWSQNPQLASLMSQPRQSFSKPSYLAGTRLNTRAFYGYTKSQTPGETDARTKAHALPPERQETDIGTDLNAALSRDQRCDSGTTRRSSVATRTDLSVGPAREPIQLEDEEQLRRRQNDHHGSKSSGASSASLFTERRPGLPTYSPHAKNDAAVVSTAPTTFAERMAKRRADMAKRKKREDDGTVAG